MRGLTRRQFVQAAGAIVLAAVWSAGCAVRSTPPQPARIGVISPGAPGPSVYLDAFRDRLSELGYVEGQNVVLEYRYAGGQLERFPELAAELVALPVEVLLSFGGTPQTAAMKERITTTPIIFVAAGDPVRGGLVASLAQPGGNVTGLSTSAVQLGGKRLEMLKEAIPGITRVALLWNAANAAKAEELRAAQATAPSLGLQPHSLEVREANDFESALQAAAREGAEGLSVLNDPLVFTNRTRVVRLAAESHLPAVYESRDFVEAGGLMAYGPSFTATVRRAATYVDKVLKGAKPADLPVEQPMTFDFVINLKTAQALGLTIPPHVLLQATEVLQ